MSSTAPHQSVIWFDLFHQRAYWTRQVWLDKHNRILWALVFIWRLFWFWWSIKFTETVFYSKKTPQSYSRRLTNSTPFWYLKLFFTFLGQLLSSVCCLYQHALCWWTHIIRFGLCISLNWYLHTCHASAQQTAGLQWDDFWGVFNFSC